MLSEWRNILLPVAVAALLAAPALAADDDDPRSRAPRGSVARQLWLKARLATLAPGETLTASLESNRREWELLSPERRQWYVKQAMAFLGLPADEQERRLRNLTRVIRMDEQTREAYRRRAEWLKVVVGSFTADERKQLLALPLKEQARRILDQKEELIRQGKLAADQPTTQPTP